MSLTGSFSRFAVERHTPHIPPVLRGEGTGDLQYTITITLL